MRLLVFVCIGFLVFSAISFFENRNYEGIFLLGVAFLGSQMVGLLGVLDRIDRLEKKLGLPSVPSPTDRAENKGKNLSGNGDKGGTSTDRE
jgi:hypothetical protein